MVDASIKNKTQAKAANPAQQKDSAVPSLKAGNESKAIIKEHQNRENVAGAQQLAINALYKAATAPAGTRSRTNVNTSPSSLRSRSHRPEKAKTHEKHSHKDPSTVSAEVREQMAIRAATTRSNATASSNRTNQSRRSIVPGRTSIDGQDAETEESLQHTLVGKDSIEEGIATKVRFGTETSTDLADNTATNNIQVTPDQALDTITLTTSPETLKLLDVIGPEAILTFREKLQQVWVTLDDNAARQLDVIARMPATLSGASAMELLMVESPQGIHFVAFLKNKNDFEVLATFDRRALLPESPSRQLLEAGLMSYEQLDSVFKEGGKKIEESVKEVASTRGTNDQVFMELQRLMVQEKRRRRKFRQMMDYFIDKLDELDLEGDPDDAPFVPRELSNKNNQVLSRNQEQDSIDEEFSEELDRTVVNKRGSKNGYVPHRDENDFH